MKTALATLLIGFVLAVAAIALAAKWLIPANEDPTPSQITVLGESRLVGEPDRAVVTFYLRKSGKTVDAAQKQASALMAKVIAALDEAGINKEDIKTSHISISQEWNSSNKPPTAHRVSSTVTITVHNVQHVGRVVDTCVATGLTRLGHVTYDVRSPKWKEKGLREALDNAHKRADDVAKQLGRPLGRVLSVRERTEWETEPAQRRRGYVTSIHGAASFDEWMPTTRSLPGQHALTTVAEVVYEL
jgi:uncharacterized protein YggE